MSAEGSTKVVLIALGCNFGIAVAKFAAAAFTGSSAMLSEAIHSLVDTSNQVLLFHGLRRAARPADARHPFGYAMELYFWSFVVAIILFSLGAGVSIYEGVDKLLHPHPISNVEVNYAVLGIALALESVSTWQALKAFNKSRNGRNAIAALRQSKDPALFTVLLEDLAALAGLTVALIGIAAAHMLGLDWADGAASILIGLILASVAAFLSIEIKSLLIGEAASEEVQTNVRNLLNAEGSKAGPVRAINEILTMQLGPNEVIVAASVDMEDTATAADVEAANARLTSAIKAQHPEVRYLFIDVKAAGSTAGRAGTDTAAVASPKVAPSQGNASPGKPQAETLLLPTPAAPQLPAPATPVTKPQITARPATARKGKGGKRRR